VTKLEIQHNLAIRRNHGDQCILAFCCDNGGSNCNVIRSSCKKQELKLISCQIAMSPIMILTTYKSKSLSVMCSNVHANVLVICTCIYMALNTVLAFNVLIVCVM